MTEGPLTLSVTFQYSHTLGVFVGTLPNGTRFQFINPPDAPMPIKLANALRTLTRQAVLEHQGKPLPEDGEEIDPELLVKIKEFEARYGVRKVGKEKKPKAPSALNIEDLGL